MNHSGKTDLSNCIYPLVFVFHEHIRTELEILLILLNPVAQTLMMMMMMYVVLLP